MTVPLVADCLDVKIPASEPFCSRSCKALERKESIKDKPRKPKPNPDGAPILIAVLWNKELQKKEYTLSLSALSYPSQTTALASRRAPQRLS